MISKFIHSPECTLRVVILDWLAKWEGQGQLAHRVINSYKEGSWNFYELDCRGYSVQSCRIKVSLGNSRLCYRAVAETQIEKTGC